MEHSYKKAAAAVIALALIAAVVVGIVLASPTSPTAVPSGEASSSVTTTNAAIGDTGVGEATHLTTEEQVLERWSSEIDGTPTVQFIDSAPTLETFLESGGENKIGVLTRDISYSIEQQSRLGTDDFKGILDGNGYKLTLMVYFRAGNDLVNDATKTAHIDTAAEGIKSEIEVTGGNYTDGVGINGIDAIGLLTGVNRGTIANVTIDYSSNMALNDNPDQGWDNMLKSKKSPSYMTAFGIVAGANFGDIDNVRINLVDAEYRTSDGTTLNFQGKFVGRQRDSQVNASGRNSRSIENTLMVGTLAGVHINGAITNTYVDFASEAAEVSALADGWTGNSGLNPKDGWRNAIAIAGGMVGFFIGDSGSLTNSYLAGGGKVRAYVLNARCLNDAADRDRHAGKGFNAFSGGITGGKFKFDDGMYSNNDGNTSMINSQDGLGDLYNQIRGIVSSWTGEKWDNNNSDHKEVIDVYEDYEQHWSPVSHREFAVLIDTANLQSTPQIAYTFRYDDLYNNVPDSNYFNLKPGIDNSGYAREWYEFYSVGGDAGDRVEVTIKDNAFRLEVATGDYLEQNPEFSFGDQAQSDFGTDTGYSGTFVWSYDSSAVRPGEEDKPKNEIAMDSFLGAFARSYTFGTPPLSYKVTFGTQLQYDVAYTEGRTRKLYDGKPLDIPTLSLNDRGTPVTANSKAYEWQYLNAAGAEVVYEDTKFPLANNGSYTLRPSKDRTELIEEVETIRGTYAYYDAGNRQVARIGQGKDAQVSVTQALLDITVTQTSDGAIYTDGAWSNGVKFDVKLSDANDYVLTGQAAPTAGSGIFNSYSYRAAGSNSGTIMLETANTAFSFESKESTGANGRTYTAFTAYATNSMGQQVAVAGAGTVSRTVKIDTAAPVMQSINYYAYKGADTITGSNVHEYYFDIREGLRNNTLDPAVYEDITETIGASADGNDVWTRYPVIIIAIATDNNLSGFDSANGVTISDTAGSIVQRQINQGTGKDTVSTSAGPLEIEQDRYLPKGAAAVVGYVSSSNAVEVRLTDNAGNVTNITDDDDKGFVVGKLNVDTVELKLNSIDESSYYVVGGWQDWWTSPLKLEIDANVGSSGAEIQYLLIDKDEMERLGATASEVVPEGYKDAWTTLGAYSDDIPAIEESFREGAALFVRLVSSKELYEPTEPLRLFVGTTVSDPKLENGLYPYLYVDLITVTLNLGEDAIIVTKGDTTKSLAQWRVDGQLSEIFSKQYDGTSAYDPHHTAKEAAVNARTFSIDWNKVETGDVTGTETLEALKTALDGKLYPYGSFYDASGNLAVDVKDGATTMKWEFVVDDSVAENYKYRLTFESEATGEIAATINLRDYNIGVEGIVKGDPDFDEMIVSADGDKTNELKVSYWGKNEDKYPFPFDFHYTAYGDDFYFRYALVGGTDGVYNVGGTYWLSVDAVKIVTEGSETADDEGWVPVKLNSDGSGDLFEYDNYNFHFTTQMKVTVEALSVNITSKLFKVEKNEEGVENLVEQEFSITSLPYNGSEYRVKATYRTVEGETVDAEVFVSGDDGTIIQGVGAYTVTFTTGDPNYTIRNTEEMTITIVGTNANLNLAAQTYAYNNGEPVNFAVKLADDSLFELPEGDVIEITYISGVDGDKAGSVQTYTVTMKWVDGVVTLTGDAPKEIGTYTVQMSYNGARTSEGTYQNNYTDVVLDSKMTITKATPKILGVTDSAIPYDKESHKYEVPDDPENTEDGLKMVSDYLDGSRVYDFADAEDVLVLQYLVEDGDPNDEDDWQNVDMSAAQSAGWFKNAGEYTYRYSYGGDGNYNAVTSDPVTLTINKAVYDGADLKLYKDNTNTPITLEEGNVYKVDYNGKNQYLTAKSGNFFDYSGAEPVAIEPGAEIIYFRVGNILDTPRPEALNMQDARDYEVTITITSDNYEEFTYEMHYVINAVDIPDGAIVVKTSSGSDITDGTSADAPQSLIATYTGKEHGYRADNSGEIIIEFDAEKLLEYPGTTPKYSVTYHPDGNQSNTMINAGSYSGHYQITVGLTNYKPISVYVSMKINPKNTTATIEKDETIKPTTDTNIYNVVSGMFKDVDGNEQEGTLVFTNSAGEPVPPDEKGKLPAGDYTVTMVDSNGNYLWGNVSVPITIAEPDKSHVHTDVDGDGKCDSCAADVPGIHVHSDANGDGKCDGCGAQLGGEQPQPHDHVDANGDGKCDICGVEMNNQGGNDPVIDPNEGGNTAAIVGGVLIGVAGLVVVGTIVGVILIVRKKRKNVI